MRRLLPVIFLLYAAQISAQVPFNSEYWEAEMEDSLSSLAIKPVKNPKKLLKEVMNRLKKDLEEKHRARKYFVEGTFRKKPYPPFSASGIYAVESDNGLEIAKNYSAINNITLKGFSYEKPHEMSSQDSISILDVLLHLLYFSPSHPNNMYDTGFYPMSPFVYYKETTHWYDIEAYEIDYGAERGMYRILLDKKKGRRLYNPYNHYKETWLGDYKVTAYFERNTLRIIQLKGEFKMDVAEYPFNWDHVTCRRFQVDYDEEGGAPVLKRIVFVRTSDPIDYGGIKATVQKIE